MHVPFLDLPKQHEELQEEILHTWKRILLSASFIGGKEVEMFEHDFAKACNTDHCVSVSSGTDALLLLYMALGVKPGDEIITPPNTFIATTEAITLAGGKIVFCDIDPLTHTIDPASVHDKISSRTVGIVPVHLYGQPADMDEINAIAARFNLWVVEDSCQAHLAEYKGKKTGTLGNGAAFSFYPGKNLGACGEAGAVTTNDRMLAQKIRMIRDHGQEAKYYHKREGCNARCDALQAAALRIKLPHLPEWTRLRQEKAAYYTNLLQNLPLTLPTIAAKRTHVFHLYVIQLANRNEIAKHLSEKGIATGLHYPVPLHLQEAYTHMHLPKGTFPVTEQAAETLLSLPIFPTISNKQIEYVCTTLKKYYDIR